MKGKILLFLAFFSRHFKVLFLELIPFASWGHDRLNTGTIARVSELLLLSALP
jgi:hypothetical protein